MAAASFVPTTLAKTILNGGTAINLASDTIKCLAVVAGSGIPDTTKTGIEFVTGLLSGNAEVTGTGYARQTLGSKTWAFDGSGTRLVDFGFANITFSQNAAGPTNIRYFVIFKDTGSDATSQVLLVFDPNATYSMVTGDIILSAPTGGALQAQT
jgi:hypothetical protein